MTLPKSECKQTERPEPGCDGDPRLSAYIDAVKANDGAAIKACIDSAVDEEDWVLMHRFVTVNVTAMGQLQVANQSLRVAQRNGRGWRNIAQGQLSTGQTAKNKTTQGYAQVHEAKKAKEAMGDDYLELAWK